jgi:hypothetical protein
MATTVIINGLSYTVPDSSDGDYDAAYATFMLALARQQAAQQQDAGTAQPQGQ